MRRPTRVLHLADGLGMGGSERWIWDIVRLSNPAEVVHRVVTVCPEDRPFVFADRLCRAGAYRRPEKALLNRLLGAAPPRARRALFSTLTGESAAAANLRGHGAAALEYLRFRPDVVHAHAFHGVRLGAWLKRWTGRPLVYSLCCLLAQMTDAGAGWVAEDLRRLHRLVDVFLAAPEYQPELTGLGVPPGKIDVFSGCVDVDHIQARAAERPRHRTQLRERLGIPGDARIALSVGRLTSSKGHRYAVEALPLILRRLPTVHWVLAGDGEDRAMLESVAVAHGVAPHVHLAGYVEDLLPFYAASDVYLRTPVFEGDNISSMDAMAHGLPTVGFDTGCGFDHLARIGHGLLVPNRDARSLAAAVVEILARPDRGRALGALGREEAHRHLGVRSTVDLFTQLYRGLHDRHVGGPGSQRGPWVDRAA